MLITEKAKLKITTLLIPTNRCINYPKVNKDGYGDIQEMVDGKKLHMLAHRVSYQLHTGEDISSNDIICHTCDNPACINPKHLFRGTHKDNVQDKVNKGRQAKGSKNGRYIDGRTSNKIKKDQSKAHGRKLTKEQVLKVRELREKYKIKEISELTGISISSIKDICSGRTYTCY